MRCDICKKASATVHITQTEGTRTVQVDLCQHCANKHDVDDPSGFSLAKLWAAVGKKSRGE